RVESEGRDEPAQRAARDVLVELDESVEGYRPVGAGDHATAARHAQTLRHRLLEPKGRRSEVRPEARRLAALEQLADVRVVRPRGLDEGDQARGRLASSALTRGWISRSSCCARALITRRSVRPSITSTFSRLA